MGVLLPFFQSTFTKKYNRKDFVVVFVCMFVVVNIHLGEKGDENLSGTKWH